MKCEFLNRLWVFFRTGSGKVWDKSETGSEFSLGLTTSVGQVQVLLQESNQM